MDDWIAYSLLFLAGSVAGVLSVVASGGSFLTLPLLIFMGLPPTVANGTNRVAILLQDIVAVWGFHRYRVLDWHAVLWAALPATLGSVLGVWAALMVGDEAFKKILAGLMVGVTLLTLWNPLPSDAGIASDQPTPGIRSYSETVALAIAFFGVGVYGGFVQAGVGFFILAVTTTAGLDLVRGNAVKVLSALAFTIAALGIFAWQGKVDWPMGLALAAGTVLGGLLGVRLTVQKGHAWVKGVVTAAVLVVAVMLLVGDS